MGQMVAIMIAMETNTQLTGKNPNALTRESRPYIIKSRARFKNQGRKRRKDGLYRISCIYVTVANMSCQDVIMSLLYLYHVTKMSHPLQWKMTPLQWKLRVDPSDGK